MINLFDSFFTCMRSVKGDIVYPFHTVFMTTEEIDGDFIAKYGELDEPFENFSHYGIYTSKESDRIFAMPLTTEQYDQQIKS